MLPHKDGGALFWFYKPLVCIAYTLFPIYQITYENLSGIKENLFLQNIRPSAYFLSYYISQIIEVIIFTFVYEYSDSCGTGVSNWACIFKWS